MKTEPARRRAFLSLGSNSGDRAAYLAIARDALSVLPRTLLVAASRLYETEPQQFAAQRDFLNQVVCIETGLDPSSLLAAVQAIEAEAGRVRGVRFGPRTLDIDILLYEGIESEAPELTIPHPRMTQRAFVMVPLSEIWGCRRGMRDLPVQMLARTTSEAQRVRPILASGTATTGR